MSFDIKNKRLHTRNDISKTVWYNDPAIDKDRTTVKDWIKQGDCELIPGQKPQIIKYRNLSPLQATAVLSVIRNDPSLLNIEAVRFGLISIEGEQLGKGTFGRLEGIDNSTLEILADETVELPTSEVKEVLEVVDPNNETVKINFITWLGGLIIGNSFRK